MTDTPPPPPGEAGRSGWGPEAGARMPGAPAGGWSSAPRGPWASGASPGPSGPGFARPDPAVVAGPPWPELIAVGPYTPPRMIRWPIVGGLALVVVYVILMLVVTSPTSPSHSAWLAEHQGTIDTLNRDARNLGADNPAQGGSAVRYLADWRAFHQDVGAAASLPNPGGSATVPWREMINDYFNGSAEIIQGMRTGNSSLLQQAQRDLQAGDAASREFNKAMGISPP
jgi:hypothetical protein